MKRLHRSCLTLALVALTACGGDSSSTPSLDTARAAFEAELAKNSGGKIKLLSFEKVDGVQGDLMGVPMYSLEFGGEFEFQEDGTWSVGHHLSGMCMGEYGGEPVTRGERRAFAGTIVFHKKEGGWKSKSPRVSLPE